MTQARDGFRRVVLFQPRTGWVADAKATGMLSPQYSEEGSEFETGDGRSEDISRSRRLVVPVVDVAAIHHLRIMHKEGCNLQAIAVGWNSHLMWLENSAFKIRQFGGGPGTFAGLQVILENSLFDAGIWRHQNAISGIPWECEVGVLDSDDATYYLQGPAGYKGPRWDAKGTDASIDVDGALSASASGDPTLDIYFPLAGATIEAAGNWNGTIVQRDWSGTTLSTLSHNGAPGNDDLIEDECWTLHFEVNSGTSTPQLLITDPGEAGVENRFGGIIACSDASATYAGPPPWSS